MVSRSLSEVLCSVSCLRAGGPLAQQRRWAVGAAVTCTQRHTCTHILRMPCTHVLQLEQKSEAHAQTVMHQLACHACTSIGSIDMQAALLHACVWPYLESCRVDSYTRRLLGCLECAAHLVAMYDCFMGLQSVYTHTHTHTHTAHWSSCFMAHKPPAHTSHRY